VTNVAGVKVQSAGKIYEMDAGDVAYARGEQVMVDSDRGPLLATIAVPSSREQIRESLRRILRRADARDLAAAAKLGERARELMAIARERVRARRIPIKMYKVDLQAGGNKASFYFSSEDRIDFRELVRDLSGELRLRIEMRQTGVRDEAKLVGGIGSCGRELCCTTFLPHFEPVSIKMAKDQGLVLNPTKVSGQCGRLKCCLVYEQATYQEMRKGLPKMGKRVITPAGEGRVVEVDTLRRRVRVVFAPGEFETFPAESVGPASPAGATVSLPPEPDE
jgi:cell fate regulator YaaT (PSP1 superfamily)